MNKSSHILIHKTIKTSLFKNLESKRAPHAQLFFGTEGNGMLSIAIEYASQILCKKNEYCTNKVKNFTHPDLHFIYPVATNAQVKTHPTSSKFITKWKEFNQLYPYGNLQEWYKIIDIEKKSGLIGTSEASEVSRYISLKPFESKNKVCIIWMADKMNIPCANKLLKMIEEPPPNTFFILITERIENMLPTIISRCQTTRFSPIPQEEVFEILKKKGISEDNAKSIVNQGQGNLNKISEILANKNGNVFFEKLFIDWVRTAFKTKGNKSSIITLLRWSEDITKLNKETQKTFLNYTSQFFRQALLKNYALDKLVNWQLNDSHFNFEKFSEFVHGNNILGIHNEIENALMNLSRNANSKIIFSDLSIKLTRLIHTKST